jgi:glycosidase
MKKFTSILISLLIFYSCSSQQKTGLYSVPEWSKEAIWYQIFPERFSNRDTNNDPGPIDMKGAWPYFTPDGWQVHPWESDWYKLQPWEAKLNKNFYDIVNIRRYGGDLQGVIDKLDYLKDLGITAIYLNPIFESPSLHKYDATFYHHIDNNFGPDPAGDREIWSNENHADPSTWQWTSADKLFLKLIEEVHKRNMKIIIDGVFNHTGTQFWAFKDIVKNQQESKYKDWFIINKWDDPATPESEFQYAGWMGVRDLPEIKEDENGLVTGPREHVHAVVKRWMDPNGDGDPSDGIDGWRLDVAEMVSHNFWRDFRKWVREINSEAYIVGEVWWEDWNNYKMFDAKPWLGDQFDAVMNYRFTRAVKDFVLADKVQIDAIAFTDSIKNIMSNYGGNYYVMMNLLGSHDTERLGSLAVNPDGMYDHQGNAKDNKDFDVRKPNEVELKRIKLAYGLQFTMPGAPQVYNGDEAGMWGGDDPDCRKPMVWQDISYETETSHPFGIKRIPDEVKFNSELFNWIKKLAEVRNSNKVLSLGEIEFNVIDNDENILSYRRIMGMDEIIVVVNRNPISIEINSISVNFLASKATWNDLITGDKISGGNNVVKLEPYQILILK